MDGYEENSEPENLIWTCRVCSTKTGVVFKRLELGRRTRQYNHSAQGVRNLAKWLMAVMNVKGEVNHLTLPAADSTR